jgi:hypothetical protein
MHTYSRSVYPTDVCPTGVYPINICIMRIYTTDIYPVNITSVTEHYKIKLSQQELNFFA